MYSLLTVDIMAKTNVFTDGLWHSVSVDIESGGSDRIGKINITIDGRSDTSNRQLTFTTSESYYIGGLYSQLTKFLEHISRLAYE